MKVLITDKIHVRLCISRMLLINLQNVSLKDLTVITAMVTWHNICLAQNNLKKTPHKC